MEGDAVTGIWSCSLLDTEDPAAVAEYERSLYRCFEPVLAINPLIRDLWEWDDAAKRLRTRVPYDSQLVALATERSTGVVRIAAGVGLHLDRHWQSGDYGFAPPPAAERPCEFLVFANGSGGDFNGVSLVRRFREFLFPVLWDRGYRTAWATTADHMIWFHRRIGASVVEQRDFQGYQRTLLRWDLGWGWKA